MVWLALGGLCDLLKAYHLFCVKVRNLVSKSGYQWVQTGRVGKKLVRLFSYSKVLLCFKEAYLVVMVYSWRATGKLPWAAFMGRSHGDGMLRCRVEHLQIVRSALVPLVVIQDANTWRAWELSYRLETQHLQRGMWSMAVSARERPGPQHPRIVSQGPTVERATGSLPSPRTRPQSSLAPLSTQS